MRPACAVPEGRDWHPTTVCDPGRGWRGRSCSRSSTQRVGMHGVPLPKPPHTRAPDTAAEGEASGRVQQKQGVEQAGLGRGQVQKVQPGWAPEGQSVAECLRTQERPAQAGGAQSEPILEAEPGQILLCPSLLGGLGKAVRCRPQECISGKTKAVPEEPQFPRGHGRKPPARHLFHSLGPNPPASTRAWCPASPARPYCSLALSQHPHSPVALSCPAPVSTLTATADMRLAVPQFQEGAGLAQAAVWRGYRAQGYHPWGQGQRRPVRPGRAGQVAAAGCVGSSRHPAWAGRGLACRPPRTRPVSGCAGRRHVASCGRAGPPGPQPAHKSGHPRWGGPGRCSALGAGESGLQGGSGVRQGGATPCPHAPRPMSHPARSLAVTMEPHGNQLG